MTRRGILKRAGMKRRPLKERDSRDTKYKCTGQLSRDCRTGRSDRLLDLWKDPG